VFKCAVIAATVGFLLGFGIATYWQSTLRAHDGTTRDLADSQVQVGAYQQTEQLGAAINTIESVAFKEYSHASDQNDLLFRDLATGTIGLYLNGSCGAEVTPAAAGVGMADGAGAGYSAAPGQHRAPRLDRAAEEDYRALRLGIQRCRAKVTALQDIVKEERRLGK
jgi:hypothetical protein